MFTQPNYNVIKCFIITISINAQKISIIDCKYCKYTTVYNINQITTYLKNCTHFLIHKNNVFHFIVLIHNTIKKTTIYKKKKFKNTLKNFSKKRIVQFTINVQSLNKNQIQYLYAFLIKTIFENNKLFDLFEN